MKKDVLLPLLGVLFIVLAIVGFIVGGEPPNVEDDSVQEIVDFYLDDKDSIMVGALLVGLATATFVFFANYLRTVFRETSASATILVGASIFAVGGAIDATLLIAMAEAADDIEPTSLVALQAFWDNDFVPIAVGMIVFLFSLAISILRTSVFPRWLGWVTLVLAILAVTPVGFFAFPVTGLLILVISIWLAMRARSAGAPPAAAMPPPD